MKEKTEMNNSITERKNTLERIISRITETEEEISELEDRTMEITATEQNKEKRMKRNEDSLRDIWDKIKCNNIQIIWVPEKVEREKGPEKICGRERRRWRKSKTRRSPSSPQVYQKYIYTWNCSYRTPTECWQKTSDLPKGKKLPTYLGRANEKRKNRDKRIGMGPAPVGGSCEGRKVSTH